MGIALLRLFSRKKAFSRSAARFACKLESTLIVIDRMASFEGRVIDISSGGAMFRPRLAYLMDRRDVPICLQVGGEEVFGRIVSTSSSGFGLRFDEPVEEADLFRIVGVDAPVVPTGASAETA